MEKKVAIYCRESTEKQDIETLISLCKKQALKLGFTNCKIFKDVESGYKNDRSQYLKLIEQIKTEKINVLILYESSRLTRDELEHQLVYRLFREKNVKIYTLNHGWLDLNNEDDVFLTNLLNLLDAREGRKTAKRVRDRMKELAEQGHWTGGAAPLGYDLINKKLFINEKDARIVKEIFTLFLTGNKTREQIAKLYGFERKKIIRMLKNPIYIGKLKFHQTKIKNKKVIYNENYTLLDGIHEPIIDNKTFELVQQKLKTLIRERNTQTTIFKNLLYCSCGNKLYSNRKRSISYIGKTGTSTYTTRNSYTCSNPEKSSCLTSVINEEKLFEKVIESLEIIIKNLSFEDIKENKDLEKDLKFYQKNLNSLIPKEEALTRNLLSGLISQNIFEKLILELKEQKQYYKDKINKTKKLILSEELKEDNKKVVEKYFKKIKKEKDPQKLNVFFSLIIEKIEFVNDYRIYIHLKI